MPVHPQVRDILDQGKDLPPLETLDVEAARQRCREAFCTKGTPEPVARVEDRELQLPVKRQLHTIPVRLYHPSDSPCLPVLVYFHGGGFVLNDLETHDAVCRFLCNTAGCIVLSVDYPRAPEHPYPAAFDHCWAVTQGAAGAAASMGGDPGCIAVGGDSSGGALAAGVCLKARDLGGIHICCQLLVYPCLDYYLPGTTSYYRFSSGFSLTRNMMKWFFSLYLPKGFDRDDPYLFPVRAKRHDRLPPVLMITAEYDPLRDEAEHYAALLEKAGGSVTLKRYTGMIHGFVVMHPDIDMGRNALTAAGTALKHRFYSCKCTEDEDTGQSC